ncbi:MAG: radical SAM protein [Candidatus Omnitrophica bacterium]|nr:radical SAM protein [Candidatus Omnitrophota bacterium]
MKNENDVVILPFNSAKINGKYLVSNAMGCWDALTPAEFRLLNALQLNPATALGRRLLTRGIAVDQNNIQDVIAGYRSLNANLFTDTSLHIAILTKRCNLRCTYCQAEGGASSQDMTLEVAGRVLKYLFDVANPSVVLEFQGGEPVLNWPVLEALVLNARKINTLGKKLQIVLVTNMLLLDDTKMAFLAKHQVDVCSSLDGPKDIHDRHRVDLKGQGTYSDVVARIRRFKDKFGRKVSLLPTITKYSLAHPERIIDEYVALGQDEIALRPANCMGSARCSWPDLGVTPEEFCDFYQRGLEHIIKINRQGRYLSERIARVMLTKVLAKRDPGYVDMMSPCGAGRSTMVYMPDGSAYPCDEARMLGEEMFKLGNIVNEEFDAILNKENLLNLLQASCANLWHYSSVFSPWMGYCPVVNYAVQKNIVPKVACSPMQKIQVSQYEQIFSRLIEGGDQVTIFNRWTEGKPDAATKKKTA